MLNMQNLKHLLFRLFAITRIMRGRTFYSIFLPSGCTALICLSLMSFLHGCKHKTEDRSSKLKNISAFNVDEKLLPKFVRGQLCICNEQLESEVGIYPAFKSDKPLYGSIRFAEEYGQENSGILYHFAVDESQGPGKGYDRLYFDQNHDLNLANDETRAPLKHPPKGATLENSHLKQQVCFHYLDVNFEYGSAGQRPLEIMPRLMIYKGGYTWMSFVTTKARKGKIKIGGQRCNVLLGHDGRVCGWFDNPWTALYLIPKDRSNQQASWGGSWVEADRLMAMHKIDGTLYRFSATPAGDKLTARPYDGELGTFMGGSGERDMTYIACNGSLYSKDKIVTIGGTLKNEWPQPSYKSQIPVGDYLPSSLTIQYDKLTVSISDNYHADGKPRGKISGDRYYGITIREDKPFVFDFSNEPKVMFASPAKDCRMKPGEELTVKAVLIDPEMDIMIRGLYHPRQGQKTISLDPKVIITRADGEKVAEGVMPFG